ncbi:MAG TPA: ATP-binding cassette domain-containing protein [Candidatus Caccopulliclostridium gallistercoris]|uniref:ATP-binding cassette domain-containing protein n=1 Tax=Candidatus Caccopulliclostridium gallistercoris TaxID=2840719 RepID=A0A9D1NEX0_9FIRM|nr:ATP-binding cassette domain-containing protein [Candidatus Caccopulliclostridium gallistercoris]
MLQVINVSLQFGGRVLFKDVNLKFSKGNCYGIIGANGAGKSTFLKILTGEIEPNKGEVIKDPNERMSVLVQNQNAYDDKTVLETVLLGHKRLHEIEEEKNVLYAKPDFSEADGIRAAELETEYADLGGWEADGEAKTLLTEIGISENDFNKLMSEMDPKQKVKVLLAQALFGNPDILVLDEPTNNLDFKTVRWLENFLLDFENTVIIVSHNRHFLNKVCTHICDVDYGQINMYLGNYDFWYETSQLMLRQSKEQNKKAEQRAKELKDFIARFSANASKSRQATSRKKELEKLTIEDFKPSSRKYPYINFEFTQEPGKEILIVKNLTKKGYFNNISFTINAGDKVAILCNNSLTPTMLFEILNGNIEPDSGHVHWGKTIKHTYLMQNNNPYFENCTLSIVDWLRQYSKDQTEAYIRGWLGRMLFSGEEALKPVNVLSGGEKVRCMFAKMMLEAGNFILLDEPTNHLDLESITALNKGMINFKGSMIFASHDQEIVETVANRIFDFVDENTFIDKMCTYEEYIK